MYINPKRYARPLAAALIIAGAAAFALKGPASALDVDQNRNIAARQLVDQQITYYRITVNFGDPRFPTGQKFGRLLNHTFITGIACHPTTAFNSSADFLSIGYTITPANEISATTGANASVNLQSATYQSATSAAGLGEAATSQGDVDLYVKYVHSGTTPTAGRVACEIGFVPNNDM